FDHLVGAQHDAGWYLMVDYFCLKVDHKLESGRLLNRKIGRFGAAENLRDKPRLLTIDLREARAISGKAALLSHLKPLGDGGQAQGRSATHDKSPVAGGK